MQDLYYITDMRGTFYRLQNDQLVAADGMASADVFSFEDANKRIGSGMRAKFYKVTPIETAEESYEAVAYDPHRNTLEMGDVDWSQFLTDFVDYVGQIPAYRQSLVENLSVVDQKICDVMHYIEFCEIDNQQAARTVALLQQLRDQRREIKDEMSRLDAFQNSIGTKGNAAKAATGIKQIESLDTRKYTPRQLDELFDECILRSFDEPAVDYEATEQPAVIPSPDMKEVSIMPKERKATIYDGKRVDWLEFAKAQAVFFSNIQQHIFNLQTDIEDIDKEINSILVSIEHGSYNCVQGYQVFRQLKDLRLQRKSLTQEYEILSVFSENFNCEEMLDAYEYTVGRIEALGFDPVPSMDAAVGASELVAV